MADFVPVAKTSEIPDPGTLLVEVGERLVAIDSRGRALLRA